MRTLLVLLLYGNAAFGQTLLFPKDSSVLKMIDDLPAAQPFDTGHTYHRVTEPYVYLISDNDVYNLFGYATGVKYHEFDFANYHILGSPQCRQCLQYCHHDDGQTNCHRNRCNKKWIWVIRENKKAFTEIASTTFPGHIDADIPHEWKSFFADTIITSKKDKAMTNWYTHGGGDCFATFKYNVFSDNYYPVVLLKERNYWGGCRAGGSWEFTISFKMPPGITEHTKNIILMDKYEKRGWGDQ